MNIWLQKGKDWWNECAAFSEMWKGVSMADGFRIGRITVEGFKDFTTRKEVDLQNRHVFFLGSNGNGKSSVIEAIRWGLFGSTNRPNDIVANRKHATRCRVEIGLLRGVQFSYGKSKSLI